MFQDEVTFLKPLPKDTICQLREEGCSLAEIAERTGTTVSVVRRVVGKLDRAAIRQRQEEVAMRINAERLTWSEKVARWRAETGMSEATFWRVLHRNGNPSGKG
jgi:hypothetical protein